LGRRSLVDLDGNRVDIPDPMRVVHLQFRRYAGCPLCNLHLRSFQARVVELEDAGIREVVVFHSSAAALRQSHGRPQFALIPDPRKTLYAEFGVEAG
jgi:peroxiredoxin